jgi:hypothetical protein
MGLEPDQGFRGLVLPKAGFPKEGFPDFGLPTMGFPA